MNKATELLQKSKTFFIATIDGDQPRVRPFGAAVEIDGKTYVCMNNTKNVYKQIMSSPKVELSAMLGSQWFRITGTLVRDDRNEARAAFLEQFPTPMYKANDGIFEVFYFSELSGTLSSFPDKTETF